MPYCIVSEEGKDPARIFSLFTHTGIRKLIDLQHVQCSRSFTKIAGRFNTKGPIISDLDSRWKEPYPNNAGNALDDDGKRRFREFMSLRKRNPPVDLAEGQVKSLLYRKTASMGEGISFRSSQSA